MLGLIERVSRLGVWLGGAALVIVSVVVCLEVVLRKAFLVGLSAATELSAYVLAVASAWGFAFALLKRSHVRVDAAVRLLPRRVIVWIDLVALLVLTWFAGLLVWHGYSVVTFSFEKSARAMTPLQTPLWIPQGLWLLGLAVFFLTCLVLLVRAGRLLAAGEIRAVTALIGTFSAMEEAAEEIGAARERAFLEESGKR
ncbi:MAG: TRAP transporter small permease subunit [Pseudomonadota bacterium]